MSDLSAVPAARFLGFVGSHSYSIYLWHLPFLWLVLKVGRSIGFGTNFWLQTLIYIAGSLAIGIIMAQLIEYPLLKLRDRWFPSRSVIEVNEVPMSVRAN
ncbi:MAG: hypothetical protein JNK38_17695 [Acidobacteria bacterium]|nr:hypothetical protein [Acidobacteriota bacterium]